MDEERIRDLVRAFRAGDPQAKRELFILLWERVLDFPKRYGHAESEESSLFFDAILERLFTCLDHYKERGAIPFGVWFQRVLRNAWNDSVLRAKRLSTSYHDMDVFEDENAAPHLCGARAEPGESPRHPKWRGLSVELSPEIMRLLNENERRLLFLRFPSLLARESLPAFAALFAEGKRRRALVRLFEYVQVRAERDEQAILLKLSSLHRLRFRPGDARSPDGRRAQFLRRRENLLAQLHSSLGKLTFKTVAHISGLPFGTVTCVFHRARCKIEQGMKREGEREGEGLTSRKSPRRSA